MSSFPSGHRRKWPSSSFPAAPSWNSAPSSNRWPLWRGDIRPAWLPLNWPAPGGDLASVNGLGLAMPRTIADLTSLVAQRARPAAVFVCCGESVDDIGRQELLRFSPSCRRQQVRLLVTGGAIGVLADSGLLCDCPAAAPWKALAALRENHPQVAFADALFVSTGHLTTCAGGSARATCRLPKWPPPRDLPAFRPCQNAIFCTSTSHQVQRGGAVNPAVRCIVCHGEVCITTAQRDLSPGNGPFEPGVFRCAFPSDRWRAGWWYRDPRAARRFSRPI